MGFIVEMLMRVYYESKDSRPYVIRRCSKISLIMIKEIGDYIIVNYHYVEDTRLDWGGIHPVL